MITGGCLEDAKSALAMARSHERGDGQGAARLFCTVGVHPTRASEFEDSATGSAEGHLAALLEVAKDGMSTGHVVAIGECGLDFDRLQHCPRDLQEKYFEMQFALAEQTGLPMFLHSRATDGAMVEMLRKHRSRFSGGVVPTPADIYAIHICAIHIYDIHVYSTVGSFDSRSGLNCVSLSVRNVILCRKSRCTRLMVMRRCSFYAFYLHFLPKFPSIYAFPAFYLHFIPKFPSIYTLKWVVYIEMH